MTNASSRGRSYKDFESAFSAEFTDTHHYWFCHGHYQIYPELQEAEWPGGSPPLLNASLTDCVFELARPTTAEEVNQYLKEAAAGDLSDTGL